MLYDGGLLSFLDLALYAYRRQVAFSQAVNTSSEGGMLVPSKDIAEQNVGQLFNNHITDALPPPLNAAVLSQPVKGWAPIRPSHVACLSFTPKR